MSRVYFGADHGGVELKADLLSAIRDFGGWDAEDLGTHSSVSVDYPTFAHAVTERVAAEPGSRGVLICGSGIGVCISANRRRGIRAARCHDITSAKLCREHNDANIICFGARLVGKLVAEDALQVFLATAFEGGRHSRRIDAIELP